MHYLITGGAGFIGSHLVHTILHDEPGSRITCIDNFDPFYPVEIKRLNISGLEDDSRFRLVELDISKSSVSDLFTIISEPVDVIIHLAAKAGVRPSIMDPLGYQQSNITGLQVLLDFARMKKITQFVFASSSSVYGVNDHYPWKEDEILLPISPYAMTKLAGEMLGHVYHHLYGIRFIALRFFTVYGPAQRPDLAIHKFTKAIYNSKPIPVFGDGSTSRDYTYVADTVQGILAASRYDGSGFEIINLGNNHAVTLSDLVRAIGNATGRHPLIERHPEQPGDVSKTFADISKAKRLLGYEPKTKLAEGLALFNNWFLENRVLLTKDGV